MDHTLLSAIGSLIQEARHHHAGRGCSLDEPGALPEWLRRRLAELERLTTPDALAGTLVTERDPRTAGPAGPGERAVGVLVRRLREVPGEFDFGDDAPRCAVWRRG